jgi:hypothetical protein
MKRVLFFLTSIVFFSNTSFSQFNCTGFSSTTIGYTGTVRTYVVPAGVVEVRINIKGADGGAASAAGNSSGGGASVYAYFTAVPGDVFKLLIGQKGADGDNEAGGGGASAVYKNGSLVLVAGAGGGEDNTGNGGSGVVANNGTDGTPINATTACPADHVDNARGGIGGNGGKAGEECAANLNGGGGGGGLLSAGNGKTGNYGGGAQGNASGGAGGGAGTGGVAGGWGWAGGGGSDDRESGGGGGYSGGGGAGESGSPGGGGSFIATGFGIISSGSVAGVATATPANGTGTICALVPIVLPLTLQEFTVEKSNNTALLNWKTSNEINTAFFTIERSDNNGVFYTLSTIAAVTNSNGSNQYFYTDNTALAGKTIYRIKMTDQDGRFSYSPIRWIQLKEQKGIDIYPNPATDRISIILPDTWKTGSKKIEIINASGSVVLQTTTTVSQYDIQVQQLSKGTYFVRVSKEHSGEVLSKTFQK